MVKHFQGCEGLITSFVLYPVEIVLESVVDDLSGTRKHLQQGLLVDYRSDSDQKNHRDYR